MGKFKAGTYEGAGNGKIGPIVCRVKFTDDAIKSVAITKHKEIRGIGWDLNTAPIDTFPKLIVDNQSLAIPSVVGAEATSLGILEAVADCCKQAGGNVDALKKAHFNAPPKKSDETITVDIVVIGGGIAGLATGISAIENGAKNVLLLEKQGITGGSTARSGGKLIGAGTKWQRKQGIYDTPEMMLQYLQSIGGDALEVEKLKYFCDNAYDNLLWLEEMGHPVQDVEAIHKSIVPWRIHNSMGGGGMTEGQGGEISTPMTHRFEKIGGKFSYNTTAKKLLTDADGTVVGVVADRSDGSVLTVKAQAVAITTGGYAQNKAMCARYPENAGYTTGVPNGNMGDGILLGIGAGAKNYDAPSLQTVYCNFASGCGINEEAGLIVSKTGKRVANEYTYMYHVGDALSKAKSEIAWYIACPNDPHPTVQYAMTLDSIPKAESVEELAKLMGVDPAEFEKTVARYNQLAAQGEDKDFHKPLEFMYPLNGPLYFALQMGPIVTVTYGGLDIDMEARVRNDLNMPIKGLFAAGEVAFTGFYNREYPCCGTGNGFGLHYGRVAGRVAAHELK
ncbi:MAG: FAD-dependent oxidoreductase [Oscillospiraceae bacterium]